MKSIWEANYQIKIISTWFKKTFLLLVIILTGTLGYSQSANRMLAELNGQWELDDNNNISILKIIEAPQLGKDEIFNRALNYFTYNYVSGKSVIQTQDKDNGLIVAKGVFESIHTSVLGRVLDAWHVVRVDVKDGRARIIVTLTDFDQSVSSEGIVHTFSSTKVADIYPVNPKGGQKTLMTKAFYKAYHKAFDTLEDIEKAIKDGNTSRAIENSDW